jgi:ABC-type transporter Mla subunit MlaD
MGFGSTAKKLQKVTEVADKLQDRFEHLREQVSDLSDTVEDTHDRVEDVEAELAEQRELLEAIAESSAVDVDQVVSGDSEGTTDVTGTNHGDAAEADSTEATVTSTPADAAESGDGND